MTKQSIIDYQINMDYEIEVNVDEKTKTLSFFDMIITPCNVFTESFDTETLLDIFKKDIKLEPYELKRQIEPVFSKFNIDENLGYVFLTYGDKKEFDKNFQKLYVNEKELEDYEAKIVFENFTFLILDLKNRKVVILNNKETSSWKESFMRLFRNNGFNVNFFPYKDTDICNKLKKGFWKGVNIVVADKTKLNEYEPFGEFKNFDTDNNLDKLTLSLSLKKEQNINKESIVEHFEKEKNKYESIKIFREDETIDFINQIVTKITKIAIPKKLVKDSANVKKLEKDMYTALRENT